MKFLLSIHPLISFAAVSTVCALLAILGLIIVRKKFHEERLKENHEVAGFIFNAFGLLYAVLVAFVVFATWSSYSAAQKNIEMELNKVADLFFDAAALDEPQKKDVRTALVEYVKAVVEQDWPTMESGGRASQRTIETQRNIWKAYISVDVKTIRNLPMYEESLRQLNAMSEYRRLRWFSSRSSTPLVIWIVLIAGGIMSVAYTFFFGSRHLRAQAVMTGVYAGLNAMVLLLIYILDHPFVGYNAISSQPFRSYLEIFTRVLAQ